MPLQVSTPWPVLRAFTRRVRTFGLAISLSLWIPGAPIAAAQNLQVLNAKSRQPLPQAPLRQITNTFQFGEQVQQRLVVKFKDSWKVRALPDGTITSLVGEPLAAVEGLAAAQGLEFAPLIGLEPARIEALEQRALAMSGKAQPDLQGIVYLKGGADEQQLIALGTQLMNYPSVEFVHLSTAGINPPGDLLPTTPDHSGNQDPYTALDVGHGFDQEPLDGSGIRVSVCEYGWIYGHEDLVDVDLHPEPGQTPETFVAANDFDDHGTAAIGILASVVNGYGCDGVASGAEFYTYPEYTIESGPRRVECITAALADSAPGDIVLLEMQTSAGFVLNYVPAEFDPAVFTVVQVGTDAGVIVVAPAGNGNQDLDSATFADYQGYGNSGAILVGAGSADAEHDKLPFSTFGSRVDVQSFGESVFTLGYGDFASYGGDPNQTYTAAFNGTSSAAALVAGVCAVVQEQALELFGQRLSGSQMLAALTSGALPQGTGEPIGPFPTVPAALGSLGESPWSDLDLGLAGSFGIPTLSAQGLGTAGSSYAFLVENTLPGASVIQAVGLSDVSLDLLGGTLVPSPDLLSFGLSADGQGGLVQAGMFGDGVLPGTELFLQYWISDAAAPQGWAATNGLQIQFQ